MASRRKAEELIKQGLVTATHKWYVNSQPLIKTVTWSEVEGQPIYNQLRVYYLLNKPRGGFPVTDDKGRQDCCGSSYLNVKNVFILGTFGLGYIRCFGLTNDRFIDEMIFTPVMRLIRSMLWQVKGNIKIISPPLVDLRLMARNQASCLWNPQSGSSRNRSVVQLTIQEGCNHQVKKMFEAVGSVDKLSRTLFWDT